MTHRKLNRLRRQWNASRRVHKGWTPRRWDSLHHLCMLGLWGCVPAHDRGFADLRLAAACASGNR